MINRPNSSRSGIVAGATTELRRTQAAVTPNHNSGLPRKTSSPASGTVTTRPIKTTAHRQAVAIHNLSNGTVVALITIPPQAEAIPSRNNGVHRSKTRSLSKITSPGSMHSRSKCSLSNTVHLNSKANHVKWSNQGKTFSRASHVVIVAGLTTHRANHAVTAVALTASQVNRTRSVTLPRKTSTGEEVAQALALQWAERPLQWVVVEVQKVAWEDIN